MQPRSLPSRSQPAWVSQRLDGPTSAALPRHRPVTSSRLHGHPSSDHQFQRVSPRPQEPPRDTWNLTKHNLSKIDKQHNEHTDSYESEKRSRALQLAGEQLGFNLRLECYAPAATNVNDWRRTQYTVGLFEERPIFKDPKDVNAMNSIAQSFDVAAEVGSTDRRRL
jgi:hypothetical protein